MPLEHFRRYLISLKVSRKIARLRERKANCAIITSFPFFRLVNSSCSVFLPTNQRVARKHLVIVERPCDSSGKKGCTQQINRFNVHNPIQQKLKIRTFRFFVNLEVLAKILKTRPQQNKSCTSQEFSQRSQQVSINSYTLQ